MFNVILYVYAAVAFLLLVSLAWMWLRDSNARKKICRNFVFTRCRVLKADALTVKTGDADAYLVALTVETESGKIADVKTRAPLEGCQAMVKDMDWHDVPILEGVNIVFGEGVLRWLPWRYVDSYRYPKELMEKAVLVC